MAAPVNQPLFEELVAPEAAEETSDAVASAVTSQEGAKAGSKPLHVKSIRLENFKGFQDSVVSLGPFNVLVGVNNSGKSTVLQALALAHTLITIHFDKRVGTDARFANGRLVSPTYLRIGSVRDLWYAQRIRSGNVWVPVRLTIEYVDGTKFTFELRNTWNTIQSKRTEPAGGAIPIDVFDRIVGRPPVLVPPSVGIVPDEEYRPAARRNGLIASGRNNEVIRNQLLDLRQQRPKVFERLGTLLNEHLAATLPDVTFDDKKDQYVHATYKESTYEHELFAAGSGFIQMVQLLTFALPQELGLLLLDEPDAHLHSSLQRVVVDILEAVAKDTGEQILIATHSKEIINYVDPSRIVPITKVEPRLEPLAPFIAPIAVLERLGTVDNVDAYWLLRGRRCVLVEGDSDKRRLRRFAGKAGTTVFEGDTQVVVIPMNGVDQDVPLLELDAFEKLIRQPVAAIQIRDRDGLPDAAVAEIVAKAKRPIHVWDRSCIENYLLDRDAVASVLMKEAGLDSETARRAADTYIEQAINDAKQDTIDRLTNRLEQHDLGVVKKPRRTPAEYAKSAREHIDANWATLEGRLRVVDGKAGLSHLRELVQKNHGVSLGDSLLVEEMAAIPAEVAAVLREIEQLRPKKG